MTELIIPKKTERHSALPVRQRERSWAEAAEYQIVLLGVESAFEACERLHQDDRLLLLKEIATRLLQRLSSAALRTKRGSSPNHRNKVSMTCHGC